MALTAEQLADLLKQNLNRDRTFGTQDLYRYLDLGQQRIVKDSPHTLGTKQSTVTLAASTQEYSLTSDFYQIRSVWHTTNSIQLKPMPHGEWTGVVEALSTIPEGPPTRYIVTHWSVTNTAWRIRLYPTPAESGTVTYFYFWMPATIDDADDVSPISRIGFDDLLLAAATMLARHRNDPEGEIQAAAQYREMIRDYRSYTPQKPDSVSRLRSQMDDFSAPTLRLPPEFPS